MTIYTQYICLYYCFLTPWEECPHMLEIILCNDWWNNLPRIKCDLEALFPYWPFIIFWSFGTFRKQIKKERQCRSILIFTSYFKYHEKAKTEAVVTVILVSLTQLYMSVIFILQKRQSLQFEQGCRMEALLLPPTSMQQFNRLTLQQLPSPSANLMHST